MTRSPSQFLTRLSLLASFSILIGCGGSQTETNPLSSHSPPVAIVGDSAPANPSSDAEPVHQVESDGIEKEQGASPPAVDAATVTPLAFETTAPLALNPGTSEVVRLAHAQVGEDVMLAHVENSLSPFSVGVDEILYLHDLGVSAPVIAAMIRRNEVLSKQHQQVEVVTIGIDDSQQETVSSGQADQVVASATTVSLESINASPSSAGGGPVTQVNNNYFYDTLSPYGQWIEVSGYGLCWRPSVAVVNQDWRPYYHGGRWVYSDAGWYWHSYYSWGWAPFHYGRWHLSPACGWVWAPDTTWGPAWVTWRWSSGYCGWAPLPPRCAYQTGVGLYYGGSRVSVSFGFGFSSACYAFVPSRYFCSPKPWLYCPPTQTINEVYGNSTVINNYVQGNNNNVIVNVGPGKAAIAQATRSEIRTVALRDSRVEAGRVVQPAGFNPQSKSLEVYRPAIASVPTVDSIASASSVRGERRSPAAEKASDSNRVLSSRTAASSSGSSNSDAVASSAERYTGSSSRQLTRSENRPTVATGSSATSVSQLEPKQRLEAATVSQQVSGSSSRRLTAPSRSDTSRAVSSPSSPSTSASRSETRSRITVPSSPPTTSQYSVVPRTSRSDFSVNSSRTITSQNPGRSETRYVNPPSAAQAPRSLAPQAPQASSRNARTYAPSSRPSQRYVPRNLTAPQSPSRSVSPTRSAPSFRPSSPSRLTAPSTGRMSTPSRSSPRSAPSRPSSAPRSGRSG